MEHVAVTFRSRSQTIKFSEMLRKRGISSRVINTPKEAGVGCGLSVQIDVKYFVIVKKIVHLSNLNSFAGFFYIKQVGNRRIVKSI